MLWWWSGSEGTNGNNDDIMTNIVPPKTNPVPPSFYSKFVISTKTSLFTINRWISGYRWRSKVNGVKNYKNGCRTVGN